MPGVCQPRAEDDDSDGIGNACEPPDTDGDGVTDDVDVQPLTFNISGDVAPGGAPDGIVNAADLLVQTQFSLGLSIPSVIELQNGDLYPEGSPDAEINTSDLTLMMKLVLP